MCQMGIALVEIRICEEKVNSRLAAVVFVSLLHISCIFAFFSSASLIQVCVSVAEQKRLATIVETVKHDTLSQASMML